MENSVECHSSLLSEKHQEKEFELLPDTMIKRYHFHKIQLSLQSADRRQKLDLRSPAQCARGVRASHWHHLTDNQKSPYSRYLLCNTTLNLYGLVPNSKLLRHELSQAANTDHAHEQKGPSRAF